MAEGPDEIEITPAMIEAGVRAFTRYDFDDHNEREVVSSIFREMSIAKAKGAPPLA